MPDLRSESFFFPAASGRRLAANLTWGGTPVPFAALVVPPLLEERKAALPTLVELCRALASAGAAAMRFDYSGTGDSEGELADGGVTADAWAAEVGDASRRLAGFAPGAPQVWIGVRTGAALALQSAAVGSAHPAAIVLWDALDGVEAIRQWLQRRMVNDMLAYGKARVSRTALEAALQGAEDAVADFDGFPFAGRLYAGLRSLGLAGCAVPALALASGRPAASLAKWAEAGEGRELRQMKAPPYWNTVGHVDASELVEATCGWLAGRFRENTSPCAGSFPPEGPDGERIVRVAGMLGVFHEARGESDGTAALFLGGWSGDRKGPHRLFTQYARRLARRGLASLRLDYNGRGESDGAVSDATIASMADNAASAIRWLVENGHAPGGVRVIAICSGCKVAITAATREAEHVRSLALWSAEAMGSLRAEGTNRRKTLSALKAYARKLLRPETWRKILKGEVRTDRVGKALVRHETRGADEAKAEDRTLKAFRSFRKPVLFLYGGSDPDAASFSAAYRAFCERNGLNARFGLVEHAGHSYYGLEWTEELLRQTESHLGGEAVKEARRNGVGRGVPVGPQG